MLIFQLVLLSTWQDGPNLHTGQSEGYRREISAYFKGLQQNLALKRETRLLAHSLTSLALSCTQTHSMSMTHSHITH